MIAISLDNALNITGYAIGCDDRLEDRGIFQTKPSESIEKRLNTIYRYLTELGIEYEFEHIFFEDVQKQVNVDTFKRLCYVQSVILLWCGDHNMSYTILSPSHGRKILNEKYKVQFGRSRAQQKETSKKFVKEHYILELGEDICDAICLGHAGGLEYKKNESAF